MYPSSERFSIWIQRFDWIFKLVRNSLFPYVDWFHFISFVKVFYLTVCQLQSSYCKQAIFQHVFLYWTWKGRDRKLVTREFIQKSKVIFHPFNSVLFNWKTFFKVCVVAKSNKYYSWKIEFTIGERCIDFLYIEGIYKIVDFSLNWVIIKWMENEI